MTAQNKALTSLLYCTIAIVSECMWNCEEHTGVCYHQWMWAIWSYFVPIHLQIISYLTQNKQHPKQAHHDTISTSICTSTPQLCPIGRTSQKHRQWIICSLICQTGATVVPASPAWYVRTVQHIMIDGWVTCLLGFSAPHHHTNRGSVTSHRLVNLAFTKFHMHTLLSHHER